jgi:uncharacterized protein
MGARCFASSRTMNRRSLLRGIAAVGCTARSALAVPSNGERLASAACAQVGITTGYGPTWTAIRYPNGDVPRSTGVCADVVIRAARDGLGLDLQKLLHEDMLAHFDAYPARRTWRSSHPDTNIDHRRVLNLETFFQRKGACIWYAKHPVPGDGFPEPLQIGDIITWLLDARLPHIGVVVGSSRSGLAAKNAECLIVHNIGRGAERSVIGEFHPHRAIGHYRWPTEF